MNLLIMKCRGIVVDKSKPVNTIIYFGVKEMDE